MSAGHAVVIGASISGLVTARVLSRHFDHVTVIDRDTLPLANANRKGVPQGWHGHGLLASGFRALKTLFPQLEQSLLAAGAVPGDVIKDVRWFQHGYYKARFTSGLDGILFSRPLLEGTLRKHVRQLPNVTVVDDTHVLGLEVDAARRRVKGVRIRRRGSEPALITGALVVDASGRSSRSPVWLDQVGYEAAPEERVEIDLAYTTRTYRRRPHHLGGDVGAVIAPLPPRQKRVGFVLAMEGDRWIVSIGGWVGDHAPAEECGYREFARSLSRPDIYDIIADADPLTDPVFYRFPSNLRRRYERMKRFPEGYLVIGDAICSFNPIYGQGMSVAALEAMALDRCLTEARSREGLWRRFFRKAGRIIDTPWMIASGSDFAFEGVTGAKPAGTDLINWYLARVHRAASTDRSVCRAFFDVANLLKPAATLFAPPVLARVMRASLMSPRRTAGLHLGAAGRKPPVAANRKPPLAASREPAEIS